MRERDVTLHLSVTATGVDLKSISERADLSEGSVAAPPIECVALLGHVARSQLSMKEDSGDIKC